MNAATQWSSTMKLQKKFKDCTPNASHLKVLTVLPSHTEASKTKTTKAGQLLAAFSCCSEISSCSYGKMWPSQALVLLQENKKQEKHSRGSSSLSCILILMCILMTALAFCLFMVTLGSIIISVSLMLFLIALEAVDLATIGNCVW